MVLLAAHTRKVSVCHHHQCLSFSCCPALVIRLVSPEVNQSSRHGAEQGSDLGPKTDVSTGLPHHLAPVRGDLGIVFTSAGISSIEMDSSQMVLWTPSSILLWDC